jgi:hypothetical protein
MGHVQAPEEVTADAIVPARIVLPRASALRVRERAEQPPKPTKAMRRLFEDR